MSHYYCKLSGGVKLRNFVVCFVKCMTRNQIFVIHLISSQLTCRTLKIKRTEQNCITPLSLHFRISRYYYFNLSGGVKLVADGVRLILKCTTADIALSFFLNIASSLRICRTVSLRYAASKHAMSKGYDIFWEISFWGFFVVVHFIFWNFL